MILYLTSRLVGSVAAFLYPGYASYKTLSQRPASEADLERWLMYWSVLGCICAVESVAEWLISWIPLYYPLKTLFLLYLALPQIRGSSYIYIHHLQPFFRTHEQQIDATLASLKTKVYAFLQDRIRQLWEMLSASLGQQSAGTRGMPAASSPPVPPPNDGWSPTQLVSSLWNAYGPAVLATGAGILSQAAIPSSSSTGSNNFQSIHERRRQLEAELAALSQAGDSPQSLPRASNEAASRLRDRTTSVTSRFEKIEVPADVEGYDVDPHEDSGFSHQQQLLQQRRTSWFGWNTTSGSGSKSGYDRIKTD